MAFFCEPIQDHLRVAAPSAAGGARRQRFDDAIGVLRYEGDLGGEILGRREAQGTGHEANLPRDENAFVYLEFGGGKSLSE